MKQSDGWQRWRRLLGGWLHASIRERQRILWLLPMLVLLCLLFLWQGKPRFERSFTLYSDAVIEQRDLERNRMSAHRSKTNASETSLARGDSTGRTTGQRGTMTGRERRYELFVFDPNTIDLEGLVRLGFSPKQAQVILNYRKAGAVFRRPADFARCYTVSAWKYAELEPYIRIGEEYRVESAAVGRPVSTKEERVTRSEDDGGQLESEGGWRKDSSAVALKTSADRRNEPSVERLASNDERHSRLLELNTADSAALVEIRGIGPLSAGRIVRYRNRLGGFVRVEQLREVRGVLEENYRLILTQIWVDSSKIQKIDINFATPEQLAGHPYLPPRVLDKILKYRQLKGGWRNAEEFVKQHILSREQAVRLAPYLRFRTQNSL